MAAVKSDQFQRAGSPDGFHSLFLRVGVWSEIGLKKKVVKGVSRMSSLQISLEKKAFSHGSNRGCPIPGASIFLRACDSSQALIF